MKPHIRSLKQGQQIWALVEEPIAQNEVIINFNGDLIRAENQTESQFRTGQRVLVEVLSLMPFKLRLVSFAQQVKAPQSLDITA